MDRRQKKTRNAVFEAFTSLISRKNYGSITIQDIIDEADIGRSTFYAHFETKEDLLKAFCQDLFEHFEMRNGKGRYSNEEAPTSLFCHILQHLYQNDHNVLNLFTCESFLGYFKDSLKNLIREQVLEQKSVQRSGLPEDFVVNHIAGSFVEMLYWWSQNRRKQTPEQLDVYFQRMLPDFVKGGAV